MTQPWTIARKELRGYFNSAIAFIFLATFLAVSLFAFFWVDKFFARGVADIRPLFDWLPLLLIFLVSALTMRLWSEEHKSGTIEVLLTLPVPVHRLVLGKFLASLFLVGLALVLTLGLPITVSMMGDLDWGPVFGGYLAALLLAAAYLAVGLCISATTDNQIVALFGTVFVCGLLYLPGIDAVAGLFGTDGELLRMLGSGSRFESIARGVIDFRDLAYYASITALFLTFNVIVLRARQWGAGARSRAHRRNANLTVVLVAANAILLNLWLAPVGAARADLTEDGRYSLADTTVDMLRGMGEPLRIRAYFTREMHPWLAPLVPEVRDLLSEYAVAGGGNVDLSIADPTEDEALEKEIFERYNISNYVLPYKDRHGEQMVNIYFHVLIEYGNQYVVLTPDDVLGNEEVDTGVYEFYLKNLEYDLTKAIRKLILAFQSVDNLFSTMPEKAVLTAYITPDSLPDNLKEVADKVRKVANELAEESGGKFEFNEVNPTTREQQQELLEKYGFRPSTVDLMSSEVFYLHLVLALGDDLARVPLTPNLSEAQLKKAITTALERTAPGFVKVVGMVVPKDQPLPQHIQMQLQQMRQEAKDRPPLAYESLRQILGKTYTMRNVDLASGSVADDIDALILAGPENLGEKEQKAVDQYVMRGGSVIVLSGGYRIDVYAEGLGVTKVDTGLSKVLDKWGITIGDKLVADPENAEFPIPKVETRGMFRRQTVEKKPYAFFPRVAPKGMKRGGNVTAGLGAIIAHFASPVRAAEGEGREVRVLMATSEDSWLHQSTDVYPDFDEHPGLGVAKPDDLTSDAKGELPIAVAVSGPFNSLFAKPGAEGEKNAEKTQEGEQPLLEHTLTDARVAVIGSSSFVSDEMLRVSQRAGAKEMENSIKLVGNLVDWALADTALLGIRARDRSSRILDVPEESRGSWEIANYAIALIGLFAVVGISRLRRRDDDLARDDGDARNEDEDEDAAGNSASEKQEEAA